MFIVLAMFSCESKQGTSETYTGAALVEMYYDQTCQLTLQEDCITEFALCDAPVSSHGSWDECMNDLHSSFRQCGMLELLFEENAVVVLNCIETLENATCTADDICPDDESILRSNDCEEVNEMLMSNCSPL